MADEPEYTLYRSRKGPLSRFKRDEPGGLDDLRRERRPAGPRTRKPISVGRVVKWVLVAAAALLLAALQSVTVAFVYYDCWIVPRRQPTRELEWGEGVGFFVFMAGFVIAHRVAWCMESSKSPL